MNKIEELLQHHCPEGVEFEELGKLGVFENIGVDKKIVAGQKIVMLLNFMDIMRNKHINTKVLNMEVSASDSKIEKCDIKKYDVFITPTSETKDEIGFAAVVDEDIPNAVYSYHIMRFRLHEKNDVSPYFISYLFDSNSLRTQILKASKGITRFGLSSKDFGKLTIPFPPLPIQQEIVNILDKFTQLDAELKAELEARRKQYEYYRSLLFDSDDTISWTELKEIADFSQGIQVDVSEQTPDIKDGFIRFLRIVDFVKDDEQPRYIKSPGQRYVKSDGDLVMIRYGASAAGKVFLKYSGAIANNLFKINLKTKDLKTKFLYYYLSQPKIYNFLNSGGGKSTMPAITFGQIGAVKIPIPLIAEQERIVGILDKFDKLVNDISEGLPAEIQARHKQYEYYRGKLLEFKNVNNG